MLLESKFGISVNERVMNNIQYADDAVIFANSADNLQKCLMN